MSKDPAVLFYTSDFLRGTEYFTLLERGQYITLLCNQHQSGHIPLGHMTTICGSSDSPVFKKFVKDEQGLYFNERMEEEIIKRKNFCDSRINNKSGRNQYSKKEGHMKGHMTGHTVGHMANENENIIKDKSYKNINISIFESLWQQYPRREGKKEALRHYNASVKTEQDQQDIQKALNNYKIKIDKEKIESKYIMHGSSWFNNWRDYVDYQPPAPTRAEILREMGIRP